MRRRALLAAAGLGATGAAGVGYLARDTIAPAGRIVARFVVGVDDDARRRDAILDERLVERDPPTVRVGVADAFADALARDRSNVVEAALHDRLTDRYDEVRYHARHLCAPDGRDTPCSTPRLTLADFNDATIGSRVRMVYRDHPWASVVHRTSAPEDLRFETGA